MKSLLILFITIFMINSIIAQPFGYVQSKTSFKQDSKDNVAWPTMSSSKLIANPQTANGYFINCFEGVYSLYKSMPEMPAGEKIQIYASMELQEGTGHFGVGFRTDAKMVYVVEINSQTGVVNLFHHPEGGGNNTILITGNMGDLKRRFAVDITIEDGKISLTNGNNNIGSANHTIQGKITNAGFIVKGRTAFRAFSFWYHNPARRPVERVIGRPFYAGFDNEGNIITNDKDNVTSWNNETGAKIATVHPKSEAAWLTEKLAIPQLGLLAEIRTERAGNGNVKAINLNVIDVLAGKVVITQNLKVKEEGKLFLGDNGTKLFHYIFSTSTVYIYNLKEFKLSHTKKIKKSKTQEILGFLTENHVVMSESKDYYSPKNIFLADLSTGANITIIKDTRDDFNFITGNAEYLLASVPNNKQAKLLKINVKTGEAIAETSISLAYNSGLFTADQNYLVLYGGVVIELIDFASFKSLYMKTISEKDDKISLLAIDPENQYIFTVENSSEKGRLFNMATGEFITEVGN